MASCKAHDDVISEISEHRVKIEQLESDRDSQKTNLAGICKDVKAIRVQLEKDEIIEDMQPTSWINKSFKTFLDRGGWVLIGWLLIKAFLFGEYPVFIQKERPYMKPLVQQMEKQNEAGRQAVIPIPEQD